MMKDMYIVKYCGGEYEDYYERDVFVTDSFETAQKYVSKFNAMLKKWKYYYELLYDACDWGDDNDWRYKMYCNRGDSVLEVIKCYWHQIEVR